MIYTSYFDNLKNIPNDIVPISICLKPKRFNGFTYKKLAPEYGFFKDYLKDRDKEKFTKCFKEQVLDLLDADLVVKELKELVGKRGHDIVLLCHEEEPRFCHRHLVAEWLRDNGYDCREW